MSTIQLTCARILRATCNHSWLKRRTRILEKTATVSLSAYVLIIGYNTNEW